MYQLLFTGKTGCIQSFDESCVLRLDDNKDKIKNNSKVVSLQCKIGPCNINKDEDEDAFSFQIKGKIIHEKSGKCLQSVGRYINSMPHVARKKALWLYRMAIAGMNDEVRKGKESTVYTHDEAIYFLVIEYMAYIKYKY